MNDDYDLAGLTAWEAEQRLSLEEAAKLLHGIDPGVSLDSKTFLDNPNWRAVLHTLSDLGEAIRAGHLAVAECWAMQLQIGVGRSYERSTLLGTTNPEAFRMARLDLGKTRITRGALGIWLKARHPARNGSADPAGAEIAKLRQQLDAATAELERLRQQAPASGLTFPYATRELEAMRAAIAEHWESYTADKRQPTQKAVALTLGELLGLQRQGNGDPARKAIELAAAIKPDTLPDA